MNAKNYTNVYNAVFGQPWAIRQENLDVIAAIITERIEGLGPRDFEPKEDPETGLVFQNGVAVIPVVGMISKRMNLFSRFSGGTSAEQIGQQFRDALESKASAILFAFDSPGGAIGGIQELASEIFKARSTSNKPVIAIAEGQCCSAAYWLASQCDEVYATEASSVGSIGVVAKIMSDDRRQKNEGIDSIVIRSHELKGIGMDPLTSNQQSALQEKIMDYFQLFKASVSRGRPGVDVEKVATGIDWIGAKALQLGLIDGIKTREEILSAYGIKK